MHLSARRCSYSEYDASRSQHGVRVLCIVCHCCAIPRYQPSRHPLAGSYLTQTQYSFETRDAMFLGYSQSFGILIVFYLSRNRTAFFQAPDASLSGREVPDDNYFSQVAFYFLRQSQIQLSLTSYVLPAAWFPIFSASSVTLTFSFAVNER